MLTIRLTRKGKKNQPFFRIVVIDKRRSASGGRAVEELGYLNPLTKKNSINKDRALYWLSVGAQASPRIHNLLVAEKIVQATKIKKFSVSKKAKAQALKASAVAPVVEATLTEPVAPVVEATLTEPVAPEVQTPAPVEEKPVV